MMILCFVFSCVKESQSFLENTGKVEFSLSIPVESTNKSSKLFQSEDTSIHSVVVSIINDKGKVVYENKKIELLNMNGYFISSPLSLTTGTYYLTEFLVTDNSNNILYLTPKKGSPKEYLVNSPLPIMFEISKDDVNKLTLEVLSAKNSSPSDFGYSTFSFNIIKTFDFLVSVFVYNDSIKNFQLTDANLIVSNSGSVLFSDNITATTNLITIRDNYTTYSLKISKSGYYSYIQTFSKDSLKLYTREGAGPLMVILKKYDEPVKKGMVVLWWDGSYEKYGFLDIDYNKIETIGSIGDMEFWSSTHPSIVFGNKLIVIGKPEAGSLKIYQCDLNSGTLIKSINLKGAGIRAIAGIYEEKPVVITDGDSSFIFGLLNIDDGEINISGPVGDMNSFINSGSWIVNKDRLIVIGYSDGGNQNIYICNLKNGKTIRTINLTEPKISTCAGIYKENLVLLWWDGINEKYGFLGIDNGRVNTIGNVGDMMWWNGSCTVFGDKLIVSGSPDGGNQKLYVCDLDLGVVLNKIEFSSPIISKILSF